MPRDKAFPKVSRRNPEEVALVLRAIADGTRHEVKVTADQGGAQGARNLARRLRDCATEHDRVLKTAVIPSGLVWLVLVQVKGEQT